jgi:hypothetical protein
MLLDIYDSEFVSHYFNVELKTLQLNYKLWNEKKGSIIFNNVIAYCIFSFSDSIGMEFDNDLSFLERALQFEYEKIPPDHGYKSYRMLNLDDDTHIKIIAKGYSFVTGNE